MPEIKTTPSGNDNPEVLIKWFKEQTEALAPGNGDKTHRDCRSDGSINWYAAIVASMTPEAFRGFLKGCCLKHLCCYEETGWIQSLKEARAYLDMLIKHIEENES